MLFFIFLGQLSHSFNTPDKSISDFKGSYQFSGYKKLNSTEENRRYIIYVPAMAERNLVQPFYAVYSLKKDTNPLDFIHIYSGIYYINKLNLHRTITSSSYQKYMSRIMWPIRSIQKKSL